MERIEDIRIILDRFYSGESTLEEEERLSAFFSRGEYPEDLQSDADLFVRLDNEADDIQVPSGLKGRILESIDRAEAKERKGRRISLYALSGLAAGILAIVAVYTGFLSKDSALMASMEYVDTYEDPEAAYEEAKRTLAFVSAKLNQGADELAHVQQITEHVARPLQSLEKMNKGSRELNLLGQLQRVKEFDN